VTAGSQTPGAFGATSFDIAGPLEHGRWSSYQKFVLLLVAMAIVLDGFDNQVLGFAIPSLIKEWGVTRAAFAPVLALGFLGMAAGTAIGGWLGDKIGRRPALISSVTLFGAATAATALADSVVHLGAFRLLAGFGLGGAMPCATALLSELSPLNRRSLAVTLGIVCIPLGGVVGGLIAAQVLPQIGWRALFAIAGCLPIVVALVLFAFLPESVRFLVRYPARRPALIKTLRRMGHVVADDAAIVDSTEKAKAERASVGALFTQDLRADTGALWIAFLFSLLATYIIYSWGPTLLVDSGFDIGLSSTALAIFNIGGVIGAIAGGMAVAAIGSRISMLTMAGGAVLGAIALALLPLGAVAQSHVLASLFVLGAFMNALQTTLYVLAAYVYPVQLRASGVGAAAGFGRLGAIAASFLGVIILTGGGRTYFISIACTLAVALIALTMVRRHSPAIRREGQPEPSATSVAAE
jgi:AAHS family 4-hydroxybenzoate transporter-like MFS transporter